MFGRYRIIFLCPQTGLGTFCGTWRFDGLLFEIVNLFLSRRFWFGGGAPQNLGEAQCSVGEFNRSVRSRSLPDNCLRLRSYGSFFVNCRGGLHRRREATFSAAIGHTLCHYCYFSAGVPALRRAVLPVPFGLRTIIRPGTRAGGVALQTEGLALTLCLADSRPTSPFPGDHRAALSLLERAPGPRLDAGGSMEQGLK